MLMMKLLMMINCDTSVMMLLMTAIFISINPVQGQRRLGVTSGSSGYKVHLYNYVVKAGTGGVNLKSPIRPPPTDLRWSSYAIDMALEADNFSASSTDEFTYIRRFNEKCQQRARRPCADVFSVYSTRKTLSMSHVALEMADIFRVFQGTKGGFSDKKIVQRKYKAANETAPYHLDISDDEKEEAKEDRMETQEAVNVNYAIYLSVYDGHHCGFASKPNHVNHGDSVRLRCQIVMNGYWVPSLYFRNEYDGSVYEGNTTICHTPGRPHRYCLVVDVQVDATVLAFACHVRFPTEGRFVPSTTTLPSYAEAQWPHHNHHSPVCYLDKIYIDTIPSDVTFLCNQMPCEETIDVGDKILCQAEAYPRPMVELSVLVATPHQEQEKKEGEHEGEEEEHEGEHEREEEEGVIPEEPNPEEEKEGGFTTQSNPEEEEKGGITTQSNPEEDGGTTIHSTPEEDWTEEEEEYAQPEEDHQEEEEEEQTVKPEEEVSRSIFLDADDGDGANGEGVSTTTEMSEMSTPLDASSSTEDGDALTTTDTRATDEEEEDQMDRTTSRGREDEEGGGGGESVSTNGDSATSTESQTTQKPEELEPETQKPEELETETQKPEELETETQEPGELETETQTPEELETETQTPEELETETQTPEKLETEENYSEESTPEGLTPEGDKGTEETSDGADGRENESTESWRDKESTEMSDEENRWLTTLRSEEREKSSREAETDYGPGKEEEETKETEKEEEPEPTEETTTEEDEEGESFTDEEEKESDVRTGEVYTVANELAGKVIEVSCNISNSLGWGYNYMVLHVRPAALPSANPNEGHSAAEATPPMTDGGTWTEAPTAEKEEGEEEKEVTVLPSVDGERTDEWTDETVKTETVDEWTEETVKTETVDEWTEETVKTETVDDAKTDEWTEKPVEPEEKEGEQSTKPEEGQEESEEDTTTEESVVSTEEHIDREDPSWRKEVPTEEEEGVSQSVNATIDDRTWQGVDRPTTTTSGTEGVEESGEEVSGDGQSSGDEFEAAQGVHPVDDPEMTTDDFLPPWTTHILPTANRGDNEAQLQLARRYGPKEIRIICNGALCVGEPRLFVGDVLKCDAQGTPPPKIYFRIEDGDRTIDSAIYELTDEDRGSMTITCIAKNQYGSMTSKLLITVSAKRKEIVQKFRKDEGSSAVGRGPRPQSIIMVAFSVLLSFAAAAAVHHRLLNEEQH